MADQQVHCDPEDAMGKRSSTNETPSRLEHEGTESVSRPHGTSRRDFLPENGVASWWESI